MGTNPLDLKPPHQWSDIPPILEIAHSTDRPELVEQELRQFDHWCERPGNVFTEAEKELSARYRAALKLLKLHQERARKAEETLADARSTFEELERSLGGNLRRFGRALGVVVVDEEEPDGT